MDRKEPWWKMLVFIPVFLLLFAMNYFIGLIDNPAYSTDIAGDWQWIRTSMMTKLPL
ncbi:MAG: hypothetical protein HPY53_12785 [Brevinematales bacterium]|nr:hypothetical protein [Brevinematales bacterium]